MTSEITLTMLSSKTKQASPLLMWVSIETFKSRSPQKGNFRSEARTSEPFKPENVLTLHLSEKKNYCPSTRVALLRKIGWINRSVKRGN